MGKKRKYYVVWKGHNPGVYDTWEECQVQIKNFPNAVYKSFTSERDATDAFLSSFDNYIGTGKKAIKSPISHTRKAAYVYPSISVDAACSGNPGVTEYQCVDTKTKAVIFRKGPFDHGTNNLGEFLGLVHALALYHKSHPTLPIYTDSKTAQAWVRNKKVKTTLERTTLNKEIFDLVDRALIWLHGNSFQNPILKWDTKGWGEIPADFGRK